jgi:hypothetical protein
MVKWSQAVRTGPKERGSIMSRRSFSAVAVVALAFTVAPSAMASAASPAARLASLNGTSVGPGSWSLPSRNVYLCESTNYKSLFVWQPDGNLVDYDGNTGRAFWSSRTATRGRYLDFSSGDGSMAVFRFSDVPALWISNAYGPAGNIYLACQNDGNVVIYDNGRALWATNTVH